MKNIENKYLWQLWFVLIIEIFFVSLFKSSISDYETVGLILVIVHGVTSTFILASSGNKYSTLFIWALIARFVFMLWDLYARNIFILPNSEGDTEFFYEWAKIISEDLSYLNASIRGGLYSKIIGVIFYFTGPMRILGQYINVLLGLMVVIYIHKVLNLLKVNDNTIKTILIIAAFFPNSLIMSAIFLREILPTFFVVVSLYYFVKWYLKNNFLIFIWSLFFVGFAAMFHSGVIGLALGYLFMFLFYDHSAEKFRFTIRNFILFIPVLAFVFLFTTQFGDVVFYKFRTLEEPSDIYESVKVAEGGSAYLQGLTINNPLQLIVYGPIRAFYFLFSPLPWNWRGIQDIILFIIDSVFYGYVFYYFFKNKKFFLQHKRIVIAILLAIVVVSFIYGIGVSNAGTAMRHRQKIVPVFLVMLGIMKHEKRRAKLFIEKLSIKKQINNK